LVNLTRALAAELGKDHINVNSIAPGNVATALNAHVRGPGNEEYSELMKTLTPTGVDFLDVEDITGTAVFLAGDDSRMIHGETILVDAGWSVW
jgi:NAD(P)-dependent dehydrogenase (short-subunit alcohol dehydrogenase family)